MKNDVEGALVSYVLAQEDLDSRLEELRCFLRTKKVDIDIETLRKEVYKVKKNVEHPKKMTELTAKLFNKDGEVREYRFGSDFCPECRLFKNYEKECPYCGHLEMTR